MSTNCRFGVLGPVTAWRDGPIELRSPRQRAVLAVLLVRPGQVVSVGELVDALWEDGCPPGAKGTLHSYLSHLRRSLEVASPPRGRDRILRRQAPGYVLAVAPEQVDAHVFERTVREGRRMVGQRRYQEALDQLQHGLALWRGAPYEEFRDCRFAAMEVARLEDLRLIATETCAEARLALGGDLHAVVDLLYPLWRRFPARERLSWLLMTALYRNGRRVEALTVFERTRAELREEFGIDPCARLRELSQLIRGCPDRREVVCANEI